MLLTTSKTSAISTLSLLYFMVQLWPETVLQLWSRQVARSRDPLVVSSCFCSSLPVIQTLSQQGHCQAYVAASLVCLKQGLEREAWHDLASMQNTSKILYGNLQAFVCTIGDDALPAFKYLMASGAKYNQQAWKELGDLPPTPLPTLL